MNLINHDKSNYVIVVGKQNIPSVLACLKFKPKNIITLYNDTAFSLPYLKPLQTILKNKLPDSDIVELKIDDMEEYFSSKQTIERALPSLLNSDYVNILNATGGTKAVALALNDAIQWDAIHYKSFKNDLEEWQPNNLNATQSSTHAFDFDVIGVDDLVSLYDVHIEKEKPSYIPKERLESLLPLAKEFNRINDDKAHPHHSVAKYLSSIWFNQDKNKQTTPHGIALDSLITLVKSNKPNLDKMIAWLEKLGSHFPEIMNLEGNTWTVHGPNAFASGHSLGKDLIEWVKGDWFEYLVYDQLSNDYLPQHMHLGLQYDAARDNNTMKNVEKPHRDIDLVIADKGELRLIEVKAGLTSNKMLSDAIRQIGSVSQFAMMPKYIVLGPFCQSFVKNDTTIARIERLARANNIRIFAHSDFIDFSKKNFFITS
ncbi:hypothetical protein N9R79_06515 [Vibrio sp.]|nr:hypothetical protein [Vibrio sp.]